ATISWPPDPLPNLVLLSPGCGGPEHTVGPDRRPRRIVCWSAPDPRVSSTRLPGGRRPLRGGSDAGGDVRAAVQARPADPISGLVGQRTGRGHGRSSGGDIEDPATARHEPVAVPPRARVEDDHAVHRVGVLDPGDG